MPRLALFAAILLALTISACAPGPGKGGRVPSAAPAAYRAGEFEGNLIAVYSWRTTETGDLAVRVPSNGCTEKAHFNPIAMGGPRDWSFDVALVRIAADNCRMPVAGGVELRWSREELYLPRSAELVLVNPRIGGPR